MARAAVAAGADDLLIEVHNDPDRALSDGAQSLFPEQFDQLMGELRVVAPTPRGDASNQASSRVRLARRLTPWCSEVDAMMPKCARP
jgi:hypothetical protein